MVNTILSVAAVHGPPPSGSSVVMDNETVPASTSAADGVYVAVALVISSKLPAPDDVHTELPALPPIEPDKGCVVPAHIDASAPAVAVAASLTVSITESGRL